MEHRGMTQGIGLHRNAWCWQAFRKFSRICGVKQLPSNQTTLPFITCPTVRRQLGNNQRLTPMRFWSTLNNGRSLCNSKHPLNALRGIEVWQPSRDYAIQVLDRCSKLNPVQQRRRKILFNDHNVGYATFICRTVKTRLHTKHKAPAMA